VFKYLDGSGKRQGVDSDDINRHLRDISGRDISAKDFRTWGGTMHMAMALHEIGIASSRREADRNIVRALDVVAEHLGNTRAVCRKFYVHPALIGAYLAGRVVEVPSLSGDRPRRARSHAALRRDEIAVLQFLHDELD